MKIRLPGKRFIDSSAKEQLWDVGNEVLYEMCRKYPLHKEPKEILAKVWIIGRTYAAALERRREKDSSNEDFYKKKVVSSFQDSDLDEELAVLRRYKELTADSLREALKIHGNLTQRFYKITRLNKRSFSSKYLHFHCPDFFFIYDSRAAASLKQYVGHLPEEYENFIGKAEVDKAYAEFSYKCFFLLQEIRKKNPEYTVRQLDNLLLA